MKLFFLLFAIFLLGFSAAILINHYKKANSNTLGLNITRDDTLIVSNTNPTGPVNPGDSYEITFFVKNLQGNVCKLCGVKIYFENPQPGDEIIPSQGKINNQGEFYTKVTSYVPEDRNLLIDVRTSEDNLNTSSVTLKYHRNNILSFVRLVTSTISKVGSLPPMGNIYARATKQRSIGENKREVDLEWNPPFGTRRVDIYTNPKDSSESGQLIKSTREKKAKIIISTLEDVYINARACTVGDSCVDSLPLLIPKISSSEGELNVPNFGFLNPSDQIANMEEEENKSFDLLGPLKNWLVGLYSSFR